MYSKSFRKTIRPHLHDGEELLAAVMAQASGSNRAMMVSALRGPSATARAHASVDRLLADANEAAEPAGLKVDRRMVVAVTSQRLLVFRQGGVLVAKAVELLGEAPIAAVESIEVDTGKLSKWVTLRVAGQAVVVETARAQPAEDLVQAFEGLRPQRLAA
jgi:hypothetical protein